MFIVRRDEGPIDKHAATNDVLFRNEPPIAAVEAYVSIVTHAEVMVGRHDDIATINEVAKPELPLDIDVRVVRIRHIGKIVAVTIVAAVMDDIWFLLRDAIHIENVVAEVNAVPGNAD